MCPPKDTTPCPQTFLGLGGSFVLGAGISFSFGLTYSEDEGLGLYASGGVHAGLDVGVAYESGVFESRADFDGVALEACVGGGAAGAGTAFCGSGAVEDGEGDGKGGTFKVGMGPSPATVTFGGTATGSVTWGDVKGFLNGVGIHLPDRPRRLNEENRDDDLR